MPIFKRCIAALALSSTSCQTTPPVVPVTDGVSVSQALVERACLTAYKEHQDQLPEGARLDPVTWHRNKAGELIGCECQFRDRYGTVPDGHVFVDLRHPDKPAILELRSNLLYLFLEQANAQ